LRARGYARIAVLGWSMGGSVVLRYAGLGGDADAVVSVSSPGAWFERGTRSMRVVHWMCETRSGRLATRVVRRTRLSGAGWPVVPESPAEVAGRIAPTPLLIVHGDRDHYFPLRHVELLAAAAPTAQLWVEEGMGHAETATTPELVDRIVDWVRGAVRADAVCDDGSRE
jgi:pimeloyl-ACP methyl ester carboxylesterase